MSPKGRRKRASPDGSEDEKKYSEKEFKEMQKTKQSEIEKIKNIQVEKLFNEIESGVKVVARNIAKSVKDEGIRSFKAVGNMISQAIKDIYHGKGLSVLMNLAEFTGRMFFYFVYNVIYYIIAFGISALFLVVATPVMILGSALKSIASAIWNRIKSMGKVTYSFVEMFVSNVCEGQTFGNVSQALKMINSAA